MSDGSDFSPTGPAHGGMVGLDGDLPAVDARPPTGDSPVLEFVRPSAIARQAVTFPDGSPVGSVDAADVIDRVTSHLAVPGEP